MRKTGIRATALAALLFGAALAWGQQPPVVPPKAEPAPEAKDPAVKSKLEEMLEKALHDNPDVRLAEAKLAEAEAELHRARLQVVQKVASAYQGVEVQKVAVERAAAELNQLKKLGAAGAVSQEDMRAVEQKLIDAKAKLAELESELNYALGQQPAGVDAKLGVWLDYTTIQPRVGDAVLMRRWYLDVTGRLPTKEEIASGALPRPSTPGPTADRIRAALDMPVTYECKDKPLTDVLRDICKAFQTANPGLLIKDNTRLGDGAGPKLSARFDKTPFGAALEWVEDSLLESEVGTFRVVVRDYGLVVAPKDELPPGAPLLDDFWKGAKAEDKAPPPAKVPSPIEGKITAIRSDGAVLLNLGGDAGVHVGDQFEAYQPGKTPGTDVNMGPIRVTEVNPTQAVAQVIGAFMEAPKEGWRVMRIR